MRILIVADDPALSFSLEQLAQKAGHPSEVVSGHGQALRIIRGDGEFLVVLPKCDLGAAAAVAERARERIATNPVETHGRLVSVTISAGGALSDAADARRSERLVAIAADTVRQAREAGGNRVCGPGLAAPPVRLIGREGPEGACSY